MSKDLYFENRQDAGEQLAAVLESYRDRPDAIVLALPRGGVPVGFAIARALHLPLDILLVRKLGLPHHPEYAMGAVASGGVRVLNREAIVGFAVPPDVVDAACERELDVIRQRERRYRAGRPEPALQGRVAILVDDGLATGSTMRVAAKVARQQHAARVVAAVPVGAPDSCLAVAAEVDELVCLSQPPGFRAVSQWYRAFDQTDDDEVQDLLDTAWRGTAPPAPAPPSIRT